MAPLDSLLDGLGGVLGEVCSSLVENVVEPALDSASIPDIIDSLLEEQPSGNAEKDKQKQDEQTVKAVSSSILPFE